MATIRQVAARSTEFADRVEDEETELGELAFADGLTALMRLYWDTADDGMARCAALFATHPWSSLATLNTRGRRG
ncbi:hypothetical protein [Amycolatopsis lexingtonensis]|uniref:hypothetical protein n=1 Tax=Amycolatopsis lexingtonensis TaxID=218822 RepID=UPI003F6FFE51